MIKNILILLFIINGYNVLSQQKITDGIITYKVINKPLDLSKMINKKDQNLKKKIKKLTDDTEVLRYILKFNKNFSLFKKEEKMYRKKSFIEILVGKGVYYTNFEENKILCQKESFGEEFLITYPFVEWNLTQETKKIGKYHCYKALAIKKIETRRGIVTKKIIAWYTLDLPIKFAPKDYGGLPGLIIEMKGENVVFRVEKIILNPKKTVNFTKPKKGKKVTLKEYNKEIKTLFYDFRKKRKH